MTVDKNSFAAFWKTNPEKGLDYIVRLRDVTGISEDGELCMALDRSRQPSGEFNLNRAIEILLEWSSEQEGRVEEGGEEKMPPAPAVIMNPVAPHSKRPVVDLTEDKDDLRRAIEMSLAEGSSTVSTATSSRPAGVSQEDQDVSKALEASLLESVNSRSSIEGQNPNERKREKDCPVGLKNVGQTCWFSAVIQSFFHLPAFRRLVIHFKPPQKDPRNDKERKILDFMIELRKLFSLLLGSQRKYVDPSAAVGILRGYLGGGQCSYSNNQQDVSEFTHKLLEWLEEAFKIRDKGISGLQDGLTNKESEAEAMDADTEKCDKEKVVAPESDKVEAAVTGRNPMFDLFYGRVRIEGKNQGLEFSREEQCGQWPLQVNLFSDIHDSLEASTAHEFIDTSSQSDLHGVSGLPPSRKSWQERWFTTLPPVLFLELSRFQYNQEKGMAEKINNFLDFPLVIYMDRYLEVNKNMTRSKRDEVKTLKEERERLKSLLHSYLEYGNDSSPLIPLVSILNRTMEFARSGAELSPGEEVLSPREISSPGNNAMQVDSPCPSPASLTPASSMVNLDTCGGSMDKSPLKTLPDGSLQIPIRIETQEKNSSTPMEIESVAEPELKPDILVPQVFGPKPKHVSELELKVLSSCLSRWKQEIEEELSSLNSALKDVEEKIQTIYDTPTLKNKAYQLHAVMVHEGSVNQGHYWAYVYHPAKKVWLKFNDNSVTETSWKCLKKESVGGRMSTSAYSMVYIDASRPDLLLESESQGLINSEMRESIPEDLEEYVQEDNKRFAGEILDWEEQSVRKTKEIEEGVLIGDDPECQIIETKPDLTLSHAKLVHEVTSNCIREISNQEMDKKKWLNAVMTDLYQRAKNKEGDNKLDSFLQYLMVVQSPKDSELVKRALLEQIFHRRIVERTEFEQFIIREAENGLRSPASLKVAEEILAWHKAYHKFRIACYYFVLGVERYHESKVEEAVDLLSTSYITNQNLIEETQTGTGNEDKGMSKRGLVKYFHLAVESLNSKLVEEFERGSNPSQVAGFVSRVLVPAINILQARTNSSADSGGRDGAVLEGVRGRWCTLLDIQMPADKHDYLISIFNTVVPDDNSVVIKQPTIKIYPKEAADLKLANSYRAIMQTVLAEEN